jgi:MFS family permease
MTTAPVADPATSSPLPRSRRLLILAVVLLSVFIMPIGISGSAIALPSIARSLGDASTPLQWVLNGFNASFAIFTIMWGLFADRFGYRLTWLAGSALFLAASAASVTAPNLGVLDAARIAAGAGGAGAVAGGAAILSHTFTGTERARAFALFGTMIGLGLALGPTIAGLLVGLAGWRGVFAATGVIITAALFGGPAMPRIAIEKQKIIDLSLLRDRRYMGYLLVPVACAVGFATLLSYLPDALGAVYGMSATASGLFMLPMTIPVLLGPLLAERLIRRPGITPATMMLIALAALFAGDLGMLVLAPGYSRWLTMAPMVAVGFGFGLPMGLVDGEAISAVEPSRAGTATGVLNFARLGSEALFVGGYAAVITALLAARLPHQVAARVAAGDPGQAVAYASVLHLVLVAMAVLVIIISAVAVWLLRPALRRHQEPRRPRLRATGE